MTTVQLGFVALRIVGLVVAFNAAAGLLATVGFLASGLESQWVASVAGTIVGSAALVVGGLWTAARARPLAERLFSSAPDGAVALTTTSMQEAAIAVLGIWLFATALPSVAVLLAQWRLASRHGDAPFGLTPAFSDFIAMPTALEHIPSFAQLIVGVVLFFGGRRIAAFWRRAVEAT